ncbi:MAG: hypothetical protein FWE90_03765 [Defluviitaleaceae bacterium]|nr:hypothetical protein [Defluviitaleaceae bacterium]
MRARKIFALLLAAIMALSLLPMSVSASTSRFPDVQQGRFYYDAVNRWATEQYGIALGDRTTGLFNPNEPLTLGTLAAFVSRTLGYERQVPVSQTTHRSLQDYIEKAVAAGLYEAVGTINGDAVVTREQAFRYMAIAFGIEPVPGNTVFTDNAQIGAQFRPYINAMVLAGHANAAGVGGGVFDPQAPYSRAQFLTVLDRMTSEILDGSVRGRIYPSNLIIRSGDVTVTDTVVNGNLIVGQGVGDGDVVLDNVTVRGDVIVYGGGADSIKIINGSSVGNLTIARIDGAVRVFVDAGSEVEFVFINDGRDDIIIEGSVNNVTVNTDVSVTINASVNSVVVQAPGANLSLEAGAEIGELTVAAINADITLGEDVVVHNLVIEETAAAASIVMEEGASVSNLVVAAEDTSLTISEGAEVETLVLYETATGFEAEGEGEIGDVISDVEDAEIAVEVTGETSTGAADFVIPEAPDVQPEPPAPPVVTPTPEPEPEPTPAPTVAPTPAPTPTIPPLGGGGGGGGGTTPTPTFGWVTADPETFKSQVLVIDGAVALIMVEVPVSAGANPGANRGATGTATALNQYRIVINTTGTVQTPASGPYAFAVINNGQTRQYRFAVDLITPGAAANHEIPTVTLQVSARNN